MKWPATACTPEDCRPMIVSYALTLAKNGSAPKPSQLRPPWATRPKFIIGLRAILTPLPACSWPIAAPRARSSQRCHLQCQNQLERSQCLINARTHVVAALIGAEKAVTKSALRTPSEEPSRHRPGKLPTEGIFPLQRPP